MKGQILAALMSAGLMAGPVHAHREGASQASAALSLLPVAVSVAAPGALLSTGAVFTVVAVEAVSEGTAWVLERASDGPRASVVLGGAASVVAGTVVACSAIATGWVLLAAGRAIAFVPNELGRALLHNERVTR